MNISSFWRHRTRAGKVGIIVAGALVLAGLTNAASGGSKTATTTTLKVVPVVGTITTVAPVTIQAAQPLATTTTVDAVATTPTPTPTGDLEVHFIDVGQGDAILIRAPDGAVALIDGGVSDSGVLAYLQTQGVEHIDLMIATHPHADHIGGLVDVLRAMPVGEVVTNGQPTTTLTYERFLDAIAAAKAKYTEAKRGDTLRLGNLAFAVLHPEAPEGDNLNDQSLVLRLVYGKVAFLFTGDAQETAEASMLAAGLPVQAQILKVGHHGSRSSSSPPFLAAVHPEVAVYSAGVGNSYGHPHMETLAALAAVGTTVFGTDKDGTVVVTADGTSYQVEVGKGTGARAPPTVTTEQILVAPAGPLSIAAVSLTSPTSPGSKARLTVKTTPGAACAITVYYKSGPSKANGLGPQTASVDGTTTWQWTVGTRTTPGTWRIVVTATLGAERTTLELPFEVG